MAGPTGNVPIDQAAEANRLAVQYMDLSQAVDDFRLDDHVPPIPPAQLAQLKTLAQQLMDKSHGFTAQAIGATLQKVQVDLAKIKTVTAQATAQLGVLNKVSKVITIASSALTLGTAIATGNPLAIISAADGLAQVLVA